jgi:hypothetical protein
MLTFSHFEKDKNQFQLIRYFIHDTTLVSGKKERDCFTSFVTSL